MKERRRRYRPILVGTFQPFNSRYILIFASETPNPETDNTNPIDQQPSPSPSPQPEGEHTHNPVKMEKEKHVEKKKAKERQQPMTDFTLINAKGFEPFVTHAPHDPVPIAMVNRAPHGSESLCAFGQTSQFAGEC